MGKPPGPNQAKASLLAFHAALLRLRTETGTLHQPIPLPQWEAALTQVLSQNGTLLTRQTCADKTWALERLGLIQKQGTGKQTTITLLNPNKETPKE